MGNKPSIVGGFAWKLLERLGVSGTQFIVQIILARLLDPEHYGVLAIMIIFTNLANVFIQTGFNTALIQNKDVTEEDYSSVFWVTLVFASIIYVLLFISAPFIAAFYKMPEIVIPFRVLALVLFPGTLNSVQIAKISRNFDFKKTFYSNLSAIIIAGLAGIVIAAFGGGLWALVIQNLLNITISCLVMYSATKLKIKFVCNIERIKVLFGFGWKLLVSGLLDTLYQNATSLIMGKKYSTSTLGYYNRGMQFPQFLVNSINSAILSVMLPAMSLKQDKTSEIKELMRKSITMSAYVIFPMMAGLAAVAAPLVSLLLTDKWLPCVPYLQLNCLIFAFYPVNSCNVQAINAMGRSDIFLKLEVIKKAYGIISLVIAVVFFESPLAVVVIGAITTWISWIVNAAPNKKLISYSYKEQINDLIPSMIISVIMFLLVSLIGQVNLSNILLLIVQVISGVIIYLILSILTKSKSFYFLLDYAKKMKNGKTSI